MLESLGGKLRILRTRLGLTQSQVASYIGVDRSTYTYWELNRTRPDWDNLRILARIFGIPAAELLDDEDRNMVSDIVSFKHRFRGVEIGRLTDSETKIILSMRVLSKQNQEVASAFIDGLINTLRSREKKCV